MSLQPFPPAVDGHALDFARQILHAEAAALAEVADRLDDGFVRAIDQLATCRGRVAVTGVGKSADIGAKIVGTFNSTGTRAYLLDPTRALHGDLGMVHPDDVALVLSHSGESDEIVRLLPPLRDLASAVIGVTGGGGSTLARSATVAVVYGPLVEACPLALAPSTSTTVMLALGDALAFVLSDLRQFSAEDFARYHPAGSLGRKLTRIEAVMRRGAEVRLASASDTVREVFARTRSAGRRTGAVMLTDADGRLCGLFTDSDLARLFERRDDAAIDRPIREVMTSRPFTVQVGTRVAEALEVLRRHKISELPVVDTAGHPVGLLDITDLIGLSAEDGQSQSAEGSELRKSA
jgi:arabinose-5-phosphate isomerase